MATSASARPARASRSSPRENRAAAWYFIQKPNGFLVPSSSSGMEGSTRDCHSLNEPMTRSPAALRPRSRSATSRRTVEASEPSSMNGLAPSAIDRSSTPIAPGRSRASSALPSAKNASAATRGTTASTSAAPMTFRSPT